MARHRFGVSLGQHTEGPNDIIAADPGFFGIPDMNSTLGVDPVAGDFALEASSPCIDQGYAGGGSIVLPDTDFGGALRDDMPDIGAFEHL